MISATGELEGLRITFISLIPDAGHVIPLLRIAVVLQRQGGTARLVCPTESLHLAEQAGIEALQFGPVQSETDGAEAARLSRQPILLQRTFGSKRYLKQATWRVEEKVFRQFHEVERLVRATAPDLIFADDRLFARQYRWLAKQMGVPLVLHYSAGSRYPQADRSAWTNISGNLERMASMVSRYHDWASLRLKRLLRPATFRDERARLAYLKSEWSRFAREVDGTEIPTHHIATGTAVLEDRVCNEMLAGAPTDWPSALPPAPPLMGDELSRDLVEWLSADRDKPILYACFGTMVNPSRNLGNRLARAALQSGARVLWASRNPPPAPLRQSSQILVKWIKWAPQTRLLARPEISAFLSHGGSGSLQESLWFGKPILCVPFQWDQFYNARVAERLGCGLAISRWEAQAGVNQKMAAVLSHATFTDNARRLSQTIRDMPTERALAELVVSATRGVTVPAT